MLNPEDLYLANTKILDDPRMHGLTLVIALSSPQDAGSTAGQLGQVLLSELKNIEIVEFDSDQLHDYRARRPYTGGPQNRHIRQTTAAPPTVTP